MYKKLKWIRVALALLVFILVTLNYLYFANSKASFLAPVLHLQFVPALLGIFSGTAIFLIIILIVTFLFGRVYCSVLCPLGIYQDIVARIALRFKSKKNRKQKFHKPHNILRYSMMLIAFIPLALGFTLPLAVLDPYSNWGRISNEILGRVELLLHNLTSLIFPESVFYRGYPVFVIAAFLFAAGMFLLVTVMSAMRGRLYCNTVCPVGTVLGAVSRFSVFRPQFGKECNKCVSCVTICKSNCIDIKEEKIDVTRCVSCLNCMTVCKKNGISYKNAYKKVKENEAELFSGERRRAIMTLGLVGTTLAARAAHIKPFARPSHEKRAIAPPGAQSIEHLKENCSACHACVATCPNSIIKPSMGEYGLDGLLLPVLDYKNHFCGYDCNACTQVCPNHALIPMTLEEKKLCQIGKAKFTLHNCIVFTDKTDCGACDEHCPTKAITMVAYKDTGLFIPSLNRDICIGCGGCEYICPAVPVKAMVVEGNAVHKTAMAPLKEEQEKKKVDDFGF
jgi:polyferredoxin